MLGQHIVDPAEMQTWTQDKEVNKEKWTQHLPLVSVNLHIWLTEATGHS